MDNLLRIINYLGKNDKAYTMHELSTLIKIPYATFYRTIMQMSGLLLMVDVGKAKTICLDKKNSIVKHYLIISSDVEKNEFLQTHPIIKKIYSELDNKHIIVLFGSYAKGTHTASSDIDLMIINKDGKRDINFSKYELLFKIKINPVFITKEEFNRMLRENEENVGKQALKTHIILNGAEKFWECVWNNSID
jgi:predicted nucleotidyltransferase